MKGNFKGCRQFLQGKILGLTFFFGNGERVKLQADSIVECIKGIRSMMKVDFATLTCTNKLSFLICEILYTSHVSTMIFDDVGDQWWEWIPQCQQEQVNKFSIYVESSRPNEDEW